MVVAAVALVRHPKTGHWKEIPPLMEKTGANALPIVLLINFLVGFVMAYQSAKQLKMFGANTYVADIVGISMTRELAPLITAIIISGRSGRRVRRRDRLDEGVRRGRRAPHARASVRFRGSSSRACSRS